ncbi:MAG: OPT family oligopeptide transporter [Planctomycetota bacterium]|nr:MAG: OPT family oligopeptide transporter [Planctomycetota bacterium]
MGLFQRPPQTPEELERSRPLDIPPEKVNEMSEEEWYARAYRGDDVPQLTWRAVLTGTVLGFVLAFTNIYAGLKTGWGLGVAITASILSFSAWKLLLRLRLARTPMTILENNCMQSTASSAGYSTGATMISAIPALLMITGEHLNIALLMVWTAAIAALGVMMAIPVKRNLINHERLRFPSGTAAAVTLQSLYGRGAEAVSKARALLFAAVTGAVVPLLFQLNLRPPERPLASGDRSLLPSVAHAFDWLPKFQDKVLSQWRIELEHSALLVAAGVLVGLRVALSMALGGLILIFAVGPAAIDAGAASSPRTAWREIGVWIGAPIMVSSGVLAFLLQWKTIRRAISGLRGGGGNGGGLVARTEVPIAWFYTGFSLATAAVVAIAWLGFGIPPHYGLLAVLMSFVLALVACRATGETDVTPIGPMGKITQLVYGVLMRGNATANLMTANITSGVAIGSADLLTDLKSGYLLGANPRRQFIAQLCGVLTGALAAVAGFRLVVKGPETLLADNTQFAAPSAHQWRVVAELFQTGIENLHPMARQGILWGLIAGAVLIVLELALPKQRRWLPSATGVGLGFILPFSNPLAFALGALGAWIYHVADRKQAELRTIPIASGLIAGESLVGITAAALNNWVLR